MDKFQELVELIQTYKVDFDKFYQKKNKSAGVRLRKHMADLKRKAQEIRNDVQDIKAKMVGEEGSKTPTA
jgi:hypothetical protein